jgi:hypothetical protein
MVSLILILKPLIDLLVGRFLVVEQDILIVVLLSRHQYFKLLLTWIPWNIDGVSFVFLKLIVEIAFE